VIRRRAPFSSDHGQPPAATAVRRRGAVRAFTFV
jgi:hypothetical protein